MPCSSRHALRASPASNHAATPCFRPSLPLLENGNSPHRPAAASVGHSSPPMARMTITGSLSPPVLESGVFLSCRIPPGPWRVSFRVCMAFTREARVQGSILSGSQAVALRARALPALVSDSPRPLQDIWGSSSHGAGKCALLAPCLTFSGCGLFCYLSPLGSWRSLVLEQMCHCVLLLHIYGPLNYTTQEGKHLSPWDRCQKGGAAPPSIPVLVLSGLQ